MDQRRAAAALFALAACFACATAAPTASNQTALDLFEAPVEGCYYNFQHYGEGDRIMTNEPCLNCTCHNRMLMCYLRVCPFTKPIGQDCTMEKRADQCCPIVTCPDVPVDLLTSTSTSSPAEYGETGLGKVDRYGCSINGKYFPEGSKVPPTPNKPCEHCYCIHNMTTCVMQECTLHVDGCTPIYHKDVCCPIRYSCDHPEDEIPLLDDMTTTVRPTPGFLLTTTTMMPVTQASQDCAHEDKIFADGALIKTEKACEHCYCMKGDIVCVVQECGTPMENEGKNCTSLSPKQGQCCPDTYICEGDELSTGSLYEETTTLSPPRRFGVEGSGYRNEPDESYTEMTSIGDIEIEGSGEEPLLTTMRNLDSDVSEVTSHNVYQYSTEINIVSSDTTSIKSDLEKDDKVLTTITSFDTTSTQTDDLSKGPDEEKDVSQMKNPTPTEQSAFTTSIEDNLTQKQDDASIELSTTKIFDQHTTVEPTITTKIDESIVITTPEITTKHSLDDIDNMTPTDEEFIIATKLPDRTVSIETTFEETLTTTKPEYVEESVTEQIISETTPKILTSTEQSTHSIGTTASRETTTINIEENEILEETLPARIPGEGDCLLDGITFKNNTSVPSSSKCHSSCKCISSIIKCDPIICTPPLEYMENMNDCQPIYDSPDSCCPTYVCNTKETIAPESHSQMSGTETPKPVKPTEYECGENGCQHNQEIEQSNLPQNDLNKCVDENCDSKKEQIPVSDAQPCDETIGCQVPIIEPCKDENCVTKPVIHTDNQHKIEIHTEPCNDENGCQVPVITPCTDNDCKITSDLPDNKEKDVQDNETDGDQENICKDENCRRKEFSETDASVSCLGTDCIQKEISSPVSIEFSSPKPEQSTQSITESELVKEPQDFTLSEKHTTLPTLLETTPLGIIKEESTPQTSMVEETTSHQTDYSKLDQLSTESPPDTFVVITSSPVVSTVEDLAAATEKIEIDHTPTSTLEDGTTRESLTTVADKMDTKPEVVSKEDENQYSTPLDETITKKPKLESTTSEAAISTQSDEERDKDQTHVTVPSYVDEKTTDKEVIIEEVVTTSAPHLLTSKSYDESSTDIMEPENLFTKEASDSDLLTKPLVEITEVPEFTSKHSITEEKEYASSTIVPDAFTKNIAETKKPETYATSTEEHDIQPSYPTISYGDESEEATHKVTDSQIEQETSVYDDVKDIQTQKTIDKDVSETVTEGSPVLTTGSAQKDKSQSEQETTSPYEDVKDIQTQKTIDKDVSEPFTEEGPLLTTEFAHKDKSQSEQETSSPHEDVKDVQTQKTIDKDVSETFTEEGPLVTTEFAQKDKSQSEQETTSPHEDVNDIQTQKTTDKDISETFTEEGPLLTTEFAQKDKSQSEQETSSPHEDVKDVQTQKTIDKDVSETFTEEGPLLTTEFAQKDKSQSEQETTSPHEDVKDIQTQKTIDKDVSETFTEEGPLLTTEFAQKDNSQLEQETSSPHEEIKDYLTQKTTGESISETFTEESPLITTEFTQKDYSLFGHETSSPQEDVKEYQTQKTFDEDINQTYTKEIPLITTESSQKDNSQLELETSSPHDDVNTYQTQKIIDKDISETYTEESPLITTEHVTSSPHYIVEEYQTQKTIEKGVSETFTEESSFTTTEFVHKDNSGIGLADFTISDKQETQTSVPKIKDTKVTEYYSTEVTQNPLADKDSSNANNELEQSTEILGTLSTLKEDELFTQSQKHIESSSQEPIVDKETTPEKVVDVTEHIMEPQDFTTRKTVESTISEELEIKTTQTVLNIDNAEIDTTPSYYEISKETTILSLPSSSQSLGETVSEVTTESYILKDTHKDTTTESSYENGDVQSTKLPEESKPDILIINEIEKEETIPSKPETQSTDKPYVQAESEDAEPTVTMSESTESSEKIDFNPIHKVESETLRTTTQSNNVPTETTELPESQFTKKESQKPETETVVESITESDFISNPDIISSTSPATISEKKEQETNIISDSLGLKEKETMPPMSLVTEKPHSFETTETITENVQTVKVTEAKESKPFEETGTQAYNEYEKTKSTEVIESMTTKQVDVMIQTVTPSIESSTEIKYPDVTTDLPKATTSNLVTNEQTSVMPAVGHSEQTVTYEEFTTHSEIESTSIISIPKAEIETKPKLPHVTSEESVEMSTLTTHLLTEKAFEGQSTEAENDVNKLIMETPVPEVTEYPVLVDQTQQQQSTTVVINAESTKKTDETTQEPQLISTVYQDINTSSYDEQTLSNNIDENMTTMIVENEPEVITKGYETPQITNDDEKPKQPMEPEYETQTRQPTVKEEILIPNQYPHIDIGSQDITVQPLSTEKIPTTISEEFITKLTNENAGLEDHINMDAISSTLKETFTTSTERTSDEKPEATTETKYEYSETTPYFVELEEHTHQIIQETSVIPAEETSTEQATERGDQSLSDKLSDELQTEKPTDITSVPQDSYPATTESNQKQSTQDVYKSTSSAYEIPDISSSSEPQEDMEIKKQDKPSDERFESTVAPLHTPSLTQNEEIITSIPLETKKPDLDTTEMTEKSQTFDNTEEEKEKPDISLQTKIPDEYTKTTTSRLIPEETSVKTTVPDDKLLEISPTTSKPITAKPEYPPIDELPAVDFPPSGGDISGYGQDIDNGEEAEEPFGPGTCRYGGKVYVSAQQIPRDDPCDFCFCFRSDIICLQQSCPPPIHGCHEEPIQGFCCPRYECPVSMATTLNVTTTTTTTTTTLPPHFLPHAYKGAAQKKGCYIKGHTYKVGEVVRASSGPCLHCTCGGDGQMKCDPKACTPEPMLRQMIAAAVSARRRR